MRPNTDQIILDKLQKIEDLIQERFQKIEALLIVSHSKEYMDINEAAQFTPFEVSTLYSYVNKRKIPFIKKNGKLVFKREVLARWLEEDSFEPNNSSKKTVGQKSVKIRL
jgi:predicted DNA-binding transcriptional regulator AlpA